MSSAEKSAEIAQKPLQKRPQKLTQKRPQKPPQKRPQKPAQKQKPPQKEKLTSILIDTTICITMISSKWTHFLSLIWTQAEVASQVQPVETLHIDDNTGSDDGSHDHWMMMVTISLDVTAIPNTFLVKYFSLFSSSFVRFSVVFVSFPFDIFFKFQISVGQGWGRTAQGMGRLNGPQP